MQVGWQEEHPIFVTRIFGSINISAGEHSFINSSNTRNEAKWNNVLRELLVLNLIEKVGDSYKVTYGGYEEADKLDKTLHIDISKDPSVYLHPQDMKKN